MTKRTSSTSAPTSTPRQRVKYDIEGWKTHLDRYSTDHTNHTSHIGIGDGMGVVSASRWSDFGMSTFGEVLHKEGKFTINTNDTTNTAEGRATDNGFPSVIQHVCYVETGDKGRTVSKIWQGTWSAATDGECKRCHVTIPEGLLTLWRLHNWDALQIWYGGQHGKD